MYQLYFSYIQYYSAWSNYEEAIKYLVTVPKYRIQATEIAKNDGLMKRDKKLDKGKTKEQIKEEDEKVGEYNIFRTSARISLHVSIGHICKSHLHFTKYLF